MKKLLLFLLWPVAGSGQNTIGLPDIINYSRQAYGAGLQNWDIRQDRNGIIYFANNEGLLSFDGRFWNLYPLPNKTIVRSIEIGPDHRIYVGGQDEMGYFNPGPNGLLRYHSLTALIPLKDRSFSDVWDIVSYKGDTYFRSPNKIFQFSHETVTAYDAPTEWSFLGIFNGKLYAHDFRRGMMVFDREIWAPLGVKNELPENDPVTALLPAGGDSALVCTLKNGLFLLSGSRITAVPSPNTGLFGRERIYAASTINAGWIALATNNGGVYITDHRGNIVQRFSRSEGLQNNNVLSIFLDSQHNLWLGLDNGIDFIAYDSPIKSITPLHQEGSGYTALIHDSRLFIGTSNGLYSVPLQPQKDLSFSKGDFSPVANTAGQTWNLAEINGQVLVGHHEGAFRVENNQALRISDQQGFWNFVPLSGTFPTGKIIAGHYKGLTLFDYQDGQFKNPRPVTGFNESSRYLALDTSGAIWVSHPYHGVYRIIRQADGSGTSRIFTEKDGLPSALNNHIFRIRHQVVVGTEQGVYRFNPGQGHFEPDPWYQGILGNISIRYLREDRAGNVWFIHEKSLGVIDLSGREPVIIYLPALNNKMLSGFEFIYPEDQNNIFLGGEKGFFHINYEKFKQPFPGLQVQVRNVLINNNRDSVLFGGYFANVNDPQRQPDQAVPRIDFSWRKIFFEYSSPLYGYQDNLEYSYRLAGFNDSWSGWTKRTEKEYDNLPAGSYSFQIRVRNNLGNESPVAVYRFRILPPWYEETWAKLLYLLLFAGSIFYLYRRQQHRFTAQQQKYEAEQQKMRYIHELEINKSESKLVTLRNEKLEAEISFKNSELASSAMHLVKKGELITRIRGEITQVMKKIRDELAISELKQVLKELNEEDNIDQEWENFARHFDKVHSDFVVRLKEIHPNISANEVKLCTYLRMNLSTKEIAQLMNISVRGVEISRYRLRKKLGIASEVSLFDYLINLPGKSPL
jgi:ligand-binding sensor domain-containing protein/DNA-binding CsgD family transcriptional regulator